MSAKIFRIVALAIAMFAPGVAMAADCPGGVVPFSCISGNTPTTADQVLGGSNTGSQSGHTVQWTFGQIGNAGLPWTVATPGMSANDSEAAPTSWVRTYVLGLGYLTTATAASTYLTIATAASTYLPKSGNGLVSSALLLRVPTITDDAAHAYAVGSYWNVPQGPFVSARSTTGAAVWTPTGIPPLPGDAFASGSQPEACYGAIKCFASYAGNWINVRTAGGATKDIGFLSTGVADMATADAFCANTTCTIPTVYDSSGNGNNCTQSTVANQLQYTPLVKIGTLPAIMSQQATYSGVNPYYCNIPTSVTASAAVSSVFWLARNGTNGENAGMVQLLNANTSYGFGYGEFMSANGTNGLLVVYPPGNTNFAAAFPSSAYFGGWSFGVSASTAYVGEQSYTLQAVGSPGSGWNQAGGLLGAINAGGGYNSGFAAFGSAVIFGRALPAADVATLKSSLYYWSGTQPQPRNNLVYVGDSITAGYATTLMQGRSTYFSTRRPYVNVTNLGITGDTICGSSGLSAVYSTYVGPLYQSNALTNIIDFFAGTNDIISGTSAAATYACLTSFVSAAHATGWKISVGTMLPRGELTGNATLQTQWNAYNALIRANTAGADYLIDFQADPDMGVLSNVSNTSLYADQIHPTNYGANILYMIEDAVLTPVFP
jgi:hypothetical protein